MRVIILSGQSKNAPNIATPTIKPISDSTLSSQCINDQLAIDFDKLFGVISLNVPSISDSPAKMDLGEVPKARSQIRSVRRIRNYILL